MKVVIPMAGTGERFRAAGYECEKGEIELLGRSLMEWALVSLRSFSGNDFVFVVRRGSYDPLWIHEAAEAAGLFEKRVRLIELDQPTRGQAETVLAAAAAIDPDEAIVVYNIDTHIRPAALSPRLIRGVGWIPVFRAPGDRWSFVQAEPDGRVTRVTEKERISELCSIGLYYFDSFRRYRSLVESRVEDGREWYIAPLYQSLIDAGLPVYMHEVDAADVFVLGTPEDLAMAESRLRPESVGRNVWME
jgi:NDP-sugar pyrophosphorylase family protein